MSLRAPYIVLAVALGGAAGSVTRYVLSAALQEHRATVFPTGTLVVNVSGCLAVGFLMRLILDTGQFSPPVRALLITGFCGGFTTFSTFAWETISALEDAAWWRAATYSIGSVILGLAAVWLGSAAAHGLVRVIRGEVA
ncbi:MAG: fluoride efflux transporter CrcB [Gemmatimonadales bacterium]